MSMKYNYSIRYSDKRLSKQRGVSLIEVMVSLFLISMGLISLTNLQTRSISLSMVAYTDTQSTLQLQEMVELLRANKVAAVNGDYNTSLTLFSDLPASDSSLAETDRYRWFNNMNKILPNAKASINCVADSSCVLELEHNFSGSATTQSIAVIL